MANLLLSTSKGYKLDQLKNWMLSAEKVRDDFDIGLVLLDDDQEIKDFCALKNIKIFAFYDAKPMEHNHFFFERCNIVSEIFMDMTDYDYVLLTDVRDVIFQENPFPKLLKTIGDKDGLLTSENIIIRNEPWNSNVFLQLFKRPIYEKIADNDVINGGVMFGKPKFLGQLNKLIFSVTHCLQGEAIRDQAGLQYLYHFYDLVKDKCVLATGKDMIVTHLAVAGPTEFYESWGFKNSLKCGQAVFDKTDNLIKHPDGEIYSIAHQYTRIPEWKSIIDDLYKIDKIKVEMAKFARKAVADGKTACVVCCHSSFNGMFNTYGWDRSVKDLDNLHLLYDATKNIDLENKIKYSFKQENIHYYDLEYLQKTFNRYEPPDISHRWADGGTRNINWFFPHLRMLYFYLANPNYDYYWYFDDDSSFKNGTINDFLNATSYIDADCVITYIFTNPEDKQEGVLAVNNKMGSYYGDYSAWLSWFPGKGDRIMPGAKRHGSYFPFVRLSKAALMKLWELHQEGYIGYSEGYVPTMLNYFGYKLHSLNKEDASLNVPEISRIRIQHKGGDILWNHL
jgi:hypothetical protein